MIKLQITCSMCGKNHPRELCIESESELTVKEIEARFEAAEEGWIVQINGDTIDTYCCESCAK